MNQDVQSQTYSIGWDVGGWNCDRNPRSRDALLILDAELAIVGQPWRGNLRSTINEANSTAEWIASLFSLCGAEKAGDHARVTLAIDTPLGFSDAFVRLVTQLEHAGSVEGSSTNQYLFRRTERFLFEQNISPLSAIKDMIGSQATKGMHVLARYANEVAECGVWSDGHLLTVIEAYPSACRASVTIQKLRSAYRSLGHEDCEDALTCSLVADLFAHDRGALVPPQEGVSSREGWIWVPGDAITHG